MSKIAITGIGGFGGRNFVNYFLNREKIVDNLKDADVVINLDALIDAPPSLLEPVKFHQYNTCGTLHTLEEIRKHNDDCHFICASSNLVYGDPLYAPIDEKHPTNPSSPYAATRVAQEAYTQAYHNSYGIATTILRFSNLYGPWGMGVINQFIEKAMDRETITIEGGSQTRTFTYIEDAALGAYLAILNRKKTNGKTYNIAGPTTMSINGIAEMLKTVFPKLKTKIIRQRHWDIKSPDFAINSAKAFAEIGYEPHYSLAGGITKIVEWEEGRRTKKRV